MSQWRAWHSAYDDPSSRLSQRLVAVQQRLSQALDAAPSRSAIRLLSLCAGEGRDLLPVLADHARGGEVAAVLVELDDALAASARARAAEFGVGDRVDVRVADAGTTAGYLDAFPAEIVMACGIFGNITDEDVETTVRHLATMTVHDGFVLWTRHRSPPDLTPAIRSWFAEAGFDEVGFDGPEGVSWGVGLHRRRVEPVRLFSFVEGRA